MIVSVHIRKAAGTSFKKALREYYGNSLLLDYGDEIGSSRLASRKKRLKSKFEMLADRKRIEREYKIVHGHFFAEKYASLKARLEYATFLRDPVERVLSNYYYLTRNPNRKHGDVVVINKHNYSLKQYICFSDAKNVQSQFLSKIPLKEFTFVGLTEEYKKSVMLFNKLFDADLGVEHNENSNPQRENQYGADSELIALIRKHNKKDVDLYEEAKEIFYRDCNFFLGQ